MQAGRFCRVPPAATRAALGICASAPCLWADGLLQAAASCWADWPTCVARGPAPLATGAHEPLDRARAQEEARAAERRAQEGPAERRPKEGPAERRAQEGLGPTTASEWVTATMQSRMAAWQALSLQERQAVHAAAEARRRAARRQWRAAELVLAAALVRQDKAAAAAAAAAAAGRGTVRGGVGQGSAGGWVGAAAAAAVPAGQRQGQGQEGLQQEQGKLSAGGGAAGGQVGAGASAEAGPPTAAVPRPHHGQQHQPRRDDLGSEPELVWVQEPPPPEKNAHRLKAWGRPGRGGGAEALSAGAGTADWVAQRQQDDAYRLLLRQQEQLLRRRMREETTGGGPQDGEGHRMGRTTCLLGTKGR